MWWLGAVLLVAAAAVAAVWQRQEIAQALRLISRVRLPQLAVAVVCEALAMLSLAAVLRWLLGAGGVRWGPGRTTALVLAGNAVAGALPGGGAVATAWIYRQLTRRGVEPAPAAAVLVTSGVLSAAGLALLLVLGMFTVGPAGRSAVLGPAVWVMVALLTAGLVLAALTGFARVRAAVRRVWSALGVRWEAVRRAQRGLGHVVREARERRPGLRPWLWPAGFALGNWVLDAACLTASLWALGIGVPWHGLLLAYALTQIPGSLRLTPGSLGVVETSLSALLVLYGVAAGPAIAGTLLYRAISYWALQPVGWACWIGVTVRERATGETGGGDVRKRA
ncbi:lysylphosphatidylglycerol synthase transmembrane domain-containing protein [Streptomyces zingiberis]|uniref:lysylphosphatidylglycerol synthase transmembrane domain-containing protein n=1 Tax=Streptomyces zingiberis TaxID=2053010 RepID=UPI002892EC57|nr:YbhN family protein [Streptomyces zingiberis]